MARATSKAAHDQIQPSIGELHERIVRRLVDGGLTDEELQERLGMAANTERPRRVELEEAGRVIDSGQRRKTKSGRAAVVWILTPDSLHEAKPPAAPAADLPALAAEGDCFAFLASLKGAQLDGCITDLPYPTLERHRARGTTTRLKSSDASSNPWFGTLPIPKLAEALAGIYDALKPNAYAFVYVDDATALLLAHELGVAPALAALTYKATSEAPRDRIGFAWWNPATWVKTSNAAPTKPRGGAGYHFPGATERILILEKGKSQLLRQYPNAFVEPRPLHPKGCAIKSATAKPIAIAENLTCAMSAPGGRILDPFIGSGTHAEGIARAGCQAVVGDANLETFRDWTRNAFKRAWMEPRNGQWERIV